MRTRSFVTATATVAALLTTIGSVASAQVRRQPLVTGDLFDVTPYVGYMVFGDYMKGPLGTSISNAPAPVYGAQLGMKLAPNVSLLANLATTSSDIKAGIPLLGGLSVAHSTMVLYDAGLQLDVPMTTMAGTTFSPFVQAGAGAIRYDLSQSLLSATATNFAANVGVGADFALGSEVGLRLMVKDYIGKFDFKDVTFVDLTGETANNFAFSAGVRFSF